MPGSVGDFRVVFFPEIDSTNKEAQRRARAGEAPNLVITAGCQTGGVGRHGRPWQSPTGNLYASILIKPALPPADIGQLAFISAVAVAETIAHFIGPSRVQLKWPNDILVDDAKLGGILIESELAGAEIAWAVIGIGLNIATAPDGLAYQTATLDALSGRENAVAAVLETLLERLAATLTQHRKHGFEPIRSAWQSHAWRLGQTVKVRSATNEFTGSFAALADDGALLLKTAAGLERITTGSLAYESAA